MRTNLLPLLACLLALPAHAQDVIADCLTTAERIDAKASKQQQPSPQEQKIFDQCLSTLSCEQSTKAQDDGKLPPDAQTSNKALLRFVGVTCGHLK